ncbi:MAG: alpha/beta hydrolase [Bacteroidetes bacterium]|nr:alpha/beta hydrolase [Bacteroidota bacterium]
MKTITLYYATNRNHLGTDQWNPTSYGTKFSDDGTENLRFGKVTLQADEATLQAHLQKDCGFGLGDGDKLTGYLTAQSKTGKIEAFQEDIDRNRSEATQPAAVYGSQAMFDELRQAMIDSANVVVMIHGFNVSWDDAVGTASALQETINARQNGKTLVVLFSWPSDGMMLPFVSYKSDRTEAAASGLAFGRGILKLRDYLIKLRRPDVDGNSQQLCNQNIHLLCHSMGNYVLQNAIGRIADFSPTSNLPRVFEHIFLCAPDVDDNIFEPGQPYQDLDDLAKFVTVYYNHNDLAMHISDYTKGNPERLGTGGAARPMMLHNKINQVDCTSIVTGLVEHSYYLCGRVADDICQSIAGLAFTDSTRTRVLVSPTNCWKMDRI